MVGSAVLNRTCLKPTYSLRRQLIVSYGCTALVTILIVVILATISAKNAGETVKSQTLARLEEQVTEVIRLSEQQTADRVTRTFQRQRGSSALLAEIIRDRIVGYPDQFSDDRFVPFVDTDTNANIYPLQGPRLPRHFEVVSNWSPETLQEHAQERVDAFEQYIGILSTNSAFFGFQGNCDPDETDPNGYAYFEGCTEANNDPFLAGAVQNISTLGGLARKADDLGIFLKPLWEAEASAFQISVYFFNSGAGAVLSFPSLRVDSKIQYVSAGCEWMTQTNPYTGESYGGEEEMKRCRPSGTSVPLRLYNPMEREFCHDQVLNPGKIRIFGPYLDSLLGKWRLTIGQAVFDRITGEFIACTGHDLNLELAVDLLDPVLTSNRTKVVITRLDGTVVAGAGLDFTDATKRFNVVDTEYIDKDTYNKLTSNKFWSESTWDGASIKNAINNNVIASGGKIVGCTPSPPPPDIYDKNYEPDFWVFASAEVDDVLAVVDEIDTAIEEEVGELVLNSILVGLGGLLIFLMVLGCLSHVLTQPLLWMEMTAWKIVNHAHKSISENLVIASAPPEKGHPLVTCSPKTEIGELVTEFQTMIRGFSGTGASRVAPNKIYEMTNFVTWKDDFRDLYQLNQSMEERIKEEMSQKVQSYGRRISVGKRSRNNSSYGPSASDIIANFSEASSASQVSEEFRAADLRHDPEVKQFGRPDSLRLFKRALTRTNLGPNLVVGGKFDTINAFEENIRVSRSSLFRCVLCSIVLPLVVTNVVIALMVANNLLNSFPDSTEKADYFSYKLDTDTLHNTGELASLFSMQVLACSLRDLHVLNRMAGWLLFDGISRSNGFAQLETSMVEDCKSYSIDEVCPFDVDPSRSPCDCKWNDPWSRQCDDFSVETRQLQKMWFVGQRRDSDPKTGNRSSSRSFPEFDFDSISTSWWSEIEELPGADKGTNASGYQTTYDRVRVMSALQTIALPLYNFFNFPGHMGVRTSFSSYFAFEADGGYLGYSGCNYDASRYATFESSDENGAYLVSPELCPRGKFGYDPRCRNWYTETRKKAQWQEKFVHITLPYRFATGAGAGTTAASPIVDPNTKEFVGTVATDFSLTEIFEYLETRTKADFYFVISPEEGLDTIIGPGHNINAPPAAISDVVLPFDEADSNNRMAFADIVSMMKEGSTGLEGFTRKNAEGIDESVMVSFYPVHARAMQAIQPNNFTRGVKTSSVLLYSIGVAKHVSSLEKTFQEIQEKIDSSLEVSAITYVVSVAVITFFSILITAKISVAITKPLLTLLNIVKRVNAGRIEDNMPPLKGGAREVTQVYNSFAKLYKIVRMSNSSFFSGDFKLAHHIGSDALQLFRKIGDEKAVAIACNNMGNTLLSLTVQQGEKGKCMKPDHVCYVQEALGHFDEAIKIGTNAFETTDSDTEKADFAQELADRHFNRAMCLILCRDDNCSPQEGKDKALKDILLCREYDRGVQEFLLHEKLMFKFSDVVFDRLLRRIHGLSLLFNLEPAVWQAWDVNDLVEQADLMLQAAWDQEQAPLFRDVTRVGRLQQLEGAVVALECTSGKLQEACQLGMRMLVEDEYIINSSFVIVADTVLKLLREPNLCWTKEAKLTTSLEFRRMRRAGKRASLDIERCFVFCLELGEKTAENEAILDVNSEILAIYDEQCHAKDKVGMVSLGDARDRVIFKLKTKEKVEDEFRSILDIESSEPSVDVNTPALPTAVNMVVSPSTSRTSDVFLIYVSDGTSVDQNAFDAMDEQIRQASGKRTASINMIAIGIDVQNESFSEGCRNLCLATRSRHSSYFQCSHDSVAETFERVTNLISSTSSFESTRIQQGITMQRF